MRILAIRGRNLASLADPFEIDLTAEPLAGAGLFAVTGETGAGKSTILDALCLALYGEYPRLAAGAREEAPDPGGVALGGRDARAILRRGAAAGHAEVDFVGVDGVGRRARWEASRARGRAGGRLQPEARLLSLLDGGGAIASGKRQVLEAVQRATGLTFDQFRRTALLAQGEFDAFLLAADGDRAELLERITGTEAYATMSTRVHEGTERRRRAVLDLERRRADVGALDDAARAALQAGSARARDALAEAAATREAAVGRLDVFRRAGAARSALADAERVLEGAARASAELADEREVLAEAGLIEPSRALLVEADAAAAARDGACRAADAAEEALAEASRAQAGAAAAHATAVEAHGVAVAACEGFGATWAHAERLDADVAAASVELDTAGARAVAARTEAERRRRELEALERERVVLAGERDVVVAESADRPGSAILVERADAVAALLAERASAEVEAAALEAGLPAREAEARRLAGEAADLSAGLAEVREARDALSGEAAANRARLEGFDEAALAARGEQLVALTFLLGRDETERLAHARVAASAAAADEDHLAATAARAAATRDGERAGSERSRVSAARAEVVALADLAEAAASEAASRLRAELRPGLACPVCGGLDHPLAETPAAADRLVAEARRRKADLDDAVERADAAVAVAAGAAAAAEGMGRRAAEAATRARSDAAKVERARAERLPHLVERLRRCGFADDPPDWGDEQVEALGAGLRKASEQARGATLAELADARRLRVEGDAIALRRDAAAATVDDLSVRLAEVGEARRRAELKRQRAAERLAAARSAVAKSGTRLDPFLAAAGMAVADLAVGATDVGARIDALVAEHRGRVARLAALDLRLRELEVAQATGAAAARAAAISADGDDEAVARRRSALDGLREARAVLLDGEATEPHRRRHEGRRLAARDALAEAEAALRVADAATRNGEAGAGAARGASRDAALRLDAARRAVARALALQLLFPEVSVAGAGLVSTAPA